MKKNNKEKKGMSKGKMIAVGAGVAAGAAAVGAGAYYLLGPDGKANQKKAKALLAKMKKEIEAGAKKMKNLSAPLYQEAVDMVSEKYAGKYKTYEKDIQALAKKLKSEWKGAKRVVKKSKSSLKKKIS